MEYCWKKSQGSQTDATVNSRSRIPSPPGMLLFPGSTGCHVQAVDSNTTHFSQAASCSAFSHSSCLPFTEKAEEPGENPSTSCCQRAAESMVLCSEARAYCCPIVGAFICLLHPILTQYCKDFYVLNYSVLYH